jgi:hypothetical protein
MPNNEQTHAKNLDNLRTAISIGESIGAAYQPSKSLIDLVKLGQFADIFEDKLQAINDVLPAENLAIKARMAGFKPVSSKTTAIMNAAKGQGLDTSEFAMLKTTANALRGIRVTPKTPDDPNTPEDESKKSVSSSNRSFAGILESLDLFVEQLKSLAGYTPNEAEYQTATLETWVAGLNTLNQTAIDAKGPPRTARNDRDTGRSFLCTNDCFYCISGYIFRNRFWFYYIRYKLDCTNGKNARTHASSNCTTTNRHSTNAPYFSKNLAIPFDSRRSCGRWR